MPRPATLDHLRSKKKPVTRSVDLVLDGDLAEAFEQAKAEYDIAVATLTANPTPEALARKDQAEQAYNDARAAAEEVVVTLTFRSMGRAPYDVLVEDHPATKEQQEKATADGIGELGYNPDTFPQALVAGSLSEPKMTLEEVQELWDSPDYNQAELGLLFAAAIEVNSVRRTVDLGKGSGGTNGSGPKSPTASRRASRTQSS